MGHRQARRMDWIRLPQTARTYYLPPWSGTFSGYRWRMDAQTCVDALAQGEGGLRRPCAGGGRVGVARCLLNQPQHAREVAIVAPRLRSEVVLSAIDLDDEAVLEA